MRRVVWVLVLWLAGCTVSYNTGGIAQVPGQLGEDPERAEQVFLAVVEDLRPVAIRECKARRGDNYCDFTLLVDLDPRSPPNAFQSVGDDGQPVLSITASMIVSVQNPDELAFIMAHEVSHHILRHIDKQKAAAASSAEAYAQKVAARGASDTEIRRAQQIGARIGAQSYAKQFEIEADRLAVLISARAGYDPRLGAAYFQRLPEPDNGFLASHPPNELREELVQKAAAEYGL